jgi:hypothetical protein
MVPVALAVPCSPSSALSPHSVIASHFKYDDSLGVGGVGFSLALPSFTPLSPSLTAAVANTATLH